MFILAGIVIIVLLLVIYYIQRIKSHCALRASFRRLWVDHGVYTRLYIISHFGNRSETNNTYSNNITALANRLMKNQEDIGGVVGSVYGKAKGDAVTSLLKTHIEGAVKILNDLKAATPATDDITKWYANGEDIAKGLAGINPKWSYAMNSQMMKKHLDLTIKEVQQYLAGDYAGSIQTYDMVMDELMEMSDYLVDNM